MTRNIKTIRAEFVERITPYEETANRFVVQKYN